MKALQKFASGPGNMELRDVEEPGCPPDKVKVAVEYCGICGTDLHVREDTFPNDPPVVLGHEFSGVVAEVGVEVDRLAVGDRVAVLGSSEITCGRCIYCQTGNYMFCPERRGMGHGTDGGMRPYVTVRPDQLYLLPEDVSLAEGALSEPFASAVHAVEEVGRPEAGDVALVSGPGPIGLMCAMLLEASGASAIVAGLPEDEGRLTKARELGVTATVEVGTDELNGLIGELTDGLGVDLAIEAAGAVPSVERCLEAIRPTGRHVQVGLLGTPFEFDVDPIVHKQIEFLGSVGHSVRTWDRVIRILRNEVVRLADLITHELPLEDWAEAFEVCERREGVKVLVKPSSAR